MRRMCGAGDPCMKDGLSIYLYAITDNMVNDYKKEAMYSADGDFLIVPQEGDLYITTEFGRFVVEPLEIIVIPRGIKFSVDVAPGKKPGDEDSDEKPKAFARGYICETYKGHFTLPDLGPIGSNSLANPMHFKTPVSYYEDVEDSEEWTITAKFGDQFHEYTQDHSPFDVVAWHGNYHPYKYDLRLFNTVGSISYDHPDPSIFTVLTCQSDDPGQAVVDFVIFPPRWLVAENTFRPPYYHRNTMSEFMGNIAGTYDAKEKGFVPGASSLHLTMSGHGPEAAVFEKASNMELPPMKVGEGSMAFMFETCYLMKLTDFAQDKRLIDTEY